MKPYYGCEHQVLEYNSCCHNQRKFFYADDLVKMLDERKKYYDESIFTPLTNEQRETIRQKYPGLIDCIAAEAMRFTIESILKELE